MDGATGKTGRRVAERAAAGVPVRRAAHQGRLYDAYLTDGIQQGLGPTAGTFTDYARRIAATGGWQAEGRAA